MPNLRKFMRLKSLLNNFNLISTFKFLNEGRRSRISPHKSMNASTSRTFTQQSPSELITNQLNTLTDRSKQRQGYYQRIRGWLVGTKVTATATVSALISEEVAAVSSVTSTNNFVFAKPSVPSLQFRLIKHKTYIKYKSME